MSVALTACEVTSNVVVVVVTIAGVIDCIAMMLAVGLASFMRSLGTCGCSTVAIVVAAAGVTGGMMLLSLVCSRLWQLLLLLLLLSHKVLWQRVW